MRVHALRGDRATVDRLTTDEVRAHAWPDLQLSHFLAETYALLGDQDQGLRWLGRSTERGFIHYPFYSRIDPC